MPVATHHRDTRTIELASGWTGVCGGKKTGDDGDMEKREGSKSSGGKHEAQADTSPWQIKHTCWPARRGEKKHMQVSGCGNWHVHASRAALSFLKINRIRIFLKIFTNFISIYNCFH